MLNKYFAFFKQAKYYVTYSSSYQKAMHYLINLLLILFSLTTNAETSKTLRIPLLHNKQVQVWKTVIYPDKKQILRPHRHEHNRVLIALTNGTLKVTNDKGNVHYLKLNKEKAYFLPKDIPGEMHTDENISQHPIKVMVIELNS